MNKLLKQAFDQVQSLPEELQAEITTQFINDLEQEAQWQKILPYPQANRLDELAEKALQHSSNGRTKVDFVDI
jgi:hypothetical protein